MNLFLKQNLPKKYKKSRSIEGAYESEDKDIINFISLDKSDFSGDCDKWMFIINVAAYDRYWVHHSNDVSQIICEISVLDKQIVLLDRWDQVTHWELNDYEGLQIELTEVILPWLEWFTKPEQLIDYLINLEALDATSKSKDAILKYGSVLSDKLYLTPPRVRRSYNGVIATLYNTIGERELALHHLKKHREFIIDDHKPTKIKSFNEAFNANMLLIDGGIEELSET